MATFLAEEPFLYQESLNVLTTLLSSQQSNKALLVVGQGYTFSQKDIDDGLAEYQKTEEFKGLVRAVQWGKKWDAYHRTNVRLDANPQQLAKELYRSIIHMIDGSTQTLKHQSLSDGCDGTDNAHNKKVIFYHARKLATILRQQPSSFVAQEPYGESKKGVKEADGGDTDNEANGENMEDGAEGGNKVLTDIDRLVVETIQPLLEEAVAYRKTVATMAPSLYLPKAVATNGELFIAIEEKKEDATQPMLETPKLKT